MSEQVSFHRLIPTLHDSTDNEHYCFIIYSFWGKLAMRDNKPATIFIKDPHVFHQYLNSTQYNVSSFDLINEDVLQLSYTLQEEFVETNPKTNVILAA